jgi:hypothetical protein
MGIGITTPLLKMTVHYKTLQKASDLDVIFGIYILNNGKRI